MSYAIQNTVLKVLAYKAGISLWDRRKLWRREAILATRFGLRVLEQRVEAVALLED